jgi:hypothetical protein
MTDTQLYLAIGVPVALNGFLLMFLLWAVRGKIGALQEHLNARFYPVNQRFGDMRDLWRAELTRVEQVLDARLKYLEQR